ncbi:FBD-associated F-box protein At3g49020 [Linum perenne]
MEPAYLAGGRSKEADRISELPDYIIHDILERLKYSQITLALSRRWMQIWLSYPILEFHCDADYHYSAKLQSFVAAAARKLSSSHHNRIKALRISSKCSDFIRDVLDLIVNREPEEIVVECYTNRSYQLFATEVINNPRLRILNLRCCKFWEFPDTNHLDMRMINLRVLRLDEFRIDERLLNCLIAASPLLEELKLGTTKSLEIMSLTCSDLDISPSALSSLKSLKINYAHKLTGEFINNMIANLPSLQSLYLYHIGGIEELKIRSDTLQELKLGHVFSNVRIHIDAPRLVDVQYRGCLLRLPAITQPANLRKAQLCNSITLSVYPFKQLIEMDSFIKLKDFLAKLRQQFRSVQLHFYFMSNSSFSGDAVACDHGSLIPMIEHVEFKFDISIMDDKDGFIDALFWSCHPKYLCLMHSKESYQGCSSLTYMAESFINRRNNDSCCKSGCKCWRHQLKDVKIVSRREDEGGEQLSDISNYLDWPYTEEKRVWFKLIWD